MIAKPRRTIRKELSSETSMELIRKELCDTPGHTLNSLARFACEKFDFTAQNGSLKTAACKVVLKDFIHRSLIPAPSSSERGARAFTSMSRMNEEIPLPSHLPTSVAEMKDDIEIILVEFGDKATLLVWNEIIATGHPLGETRLMGYQVKYLIKYKDGYIGACSFSSSALRLAARDKWIGWSDEERERHQARFQNMSRFLIRPGVSVENLASHLISRLLSCFKKDFEIRYGVAPWLVETFVDKNDYSGTCYKAANWTYLGDTKGRGRNDRHTRKSKSVKAIYVYALEPEFRSMAGLPPPPDHYAPIAFDEGLSSDVWAGREFGGINLGDERLSRRLVKIAKDKGDHPGLSYPKAVNGDRQEMKAYYALLSNDSEEISFDSLMSGHREMSIRRIRSCDTVLAIQDTTDLNYSGLRGTKGLGKIGKNDRSGSGASGLSLHSVFMVDKEGMPLGIPEAACHAPRVDGEISQKRKSKPIEEKETYRWLDSYQKTLTIAGLCPETRVITVMDREGDIYEMFELACENRQTGPVVIRVRHDRRLEGTGLKLLGLMDAAPVALTAEIKVPPQRARHETAKKKARPHMPARTAKLNISFGQVTIPAPANLSSNDRHPLALSFVHAWEQEPPEGAEPISWRLITTLGVDNADDALEIVGFYKCRWRVEEFHRVLKSVCNVEGHRQTDAERLRKVIAIDIVVAWRVMLLTVLGRDTPTLSADTIFSKEEILTLRLLDKKKSAEPISVGDACDIIGELGGHRRGGSEGPVGFEAIGKGFVRFKDIATGVALAVEKGLTSFEQIELKLNRHLIESE